MEPKTITIGGVQFYQGTIAKSEVKNGTYNVALKDGTNVQYKEQKNREKNATPSILMENAFEQNAVKFKNLNGATIFDNENKKDNYVISGCQNSTFNIRTGGDNVSVNNSSLAPKGIAPLMEYGERKSKNNIFKLNPQGEGRTLGDLKIAPSITLNVFNGGRSDLLNRMYSQKTTLKQDEKGNLIAPKK